MQLDWQKVLFLFVCADVLLVAVGFFLCRSDKQRAKAGAWRIPEKWFFWLAFWGGGIGVLLGMKSFRHKTKHSSFKYGIPALTLLSLLWQGTILYLL